MLSRQDVFLRWWSVAEPLCCPLTGWLWPVSSSQPSAVIYCKYKLFLLLLWWAAALSVDVQTCCSENTCLITLWNPDLTKFHSICWCFYKLVRCSSPLSPQEGVAASKTPDQCTETSFGDWPLLLLLALPSAGRVQHIRTFAAKPLKYFTRPVETAAGV